MSNRKTIVERIEAAKAEVAQKEAHIKALLRQQKAQERKDRNHRLCLRGGKLEKLLPGLARLTEEQFETFVGKCLLTNYTRRILAELAPQESAEPDGGADTTQGGDTAAQQSAATLATTVPAPTPISTGTANNSGANSGGRTTEAARAAS